MPANPTVPAEWHRYDEAQYNACQADAGFGQLILASFSKFSDLGQGSFGRLDGPLIAQNKTYVHYLSGYNRVEFDVMRDRQLYQCKGGQPRAASFPFGSLSVKSAWMEMTKVAHPERYYVREASVMDPDGTCHKKLVGLVGLHIVQKTSTRQQWIWSTFEQVDNVPDTPPDPLGPITAFAFNGPGSWPMGDHNRYAFDPFHPAPPPWPPPRPFNVERLKPIHPFTQNTNLAYRKALQKAGSVWQNYQLVMTQFPIEPNQTGTLAATPDKIFPGSAQDAYSKTASANVTMETYFQTAIPQSCISCHNTAYCVDFVCSVPTRACGRILSAPVGQLPMVPVPRAAMKR
jgi:hypothetical protein